MRRRNPSIYTSAAAAKRAGYGNTGYTKAELLALLRKRAKENDTDGALVIAAEAVAKGADPHVVDSIFRGSALAIEGTHGNPGKRSMPSRVARSHRLAASLHAMDRAEAKYFAGQPSAADIFGEDDPWAIEEATKTAARKAKAAARKPRPAKRNPAKKATASASLISDLKELTEYNNHAEAAFQLALDMDFIRHGNPGVLQPASYSALTRELRLVRDARDRKGYMDAALSERSYAAYKKLIAKAKRVYTAASFAKIHAAL